LKKTLELTNYGDVRASKTRLNQNNSSTEKKTIKIETDQVWKKDNGFRDIKWSKRLEFKLELKEKKNQANP